MKMCFDNDRRGVDKPFYKMGRFSIPVELVWRCGPAFMLLSALAVTLLFGPDWRYFYSTGGSVGSPRLFSIVTMHDVIAMNHMKVATNLAPEHNFLGFYNLMLTRDGEFTYKPYNRFPVGGQVLIKLVTLPFSDDLAASLRAARLLMWAFFVGTVVLAYLSLSRLIASRWAAVGATLLAFASHWILFYRDMVATEGMMDLFGMMLVFHGIAVFLAPSDWEGDLPSSMKGAGFGQLLAKICVALLLGWYVYALLLPFVILGLGGGLARRWKGQVDWTSVRRHLILSAAAVVFGVMVLGINFAREYFALGGESPLADLPSVRSMLRRTGIAEFASSGDWTWGWTVPELGKQFRRVGEASVPVALTTFLPWEVLVMLGMAAPLSVVGLLCLRSTPYRLPLAALALSGFCWTLLVSDGVRSHDFYGMFYFCVPLVLFSLVSSRLKTCVSRVYDLKSSPVHGSGRLRRAWAARLAAGGVVAALTIFTVSGWVVEQGKREAQDLEVERALTADMHAIRPLVKNKVVFLPGHWFRWNIWESRLKYSLTGSVVIRENHEFADFVVAPRLEQGDSLTPENQHIFLYRSAAVDAVRLSYERLAQTQRPVIESTWDAYHMRNALLYVGEGAECTDLNPSRLFLRTYSVHADNLLSSHMRYGFERRVFKKDWGWQRDGRCYVLAALPTYEIAKIVIGESGQGPFDSSFRLLWEASYSPPLAGGENRS